MLALEIGVHHGDHSLVVRHLPDDHRHVLQPQSLAGGKSPVAGYQLVAAALQRPGQTWGEDAHLADALHDPLHLLVVLYLEGVILEGAKLGQRNPLHLFELRFVPFLLGGEQLVHAGE